MTIEEALRSFLSLSPGVVERTAERIYENQEPQGKGQPSILLRRAGTTDILALDGLTELTDTHVEVECRADTALAASALARAVRKANGGTPTGPVLEEYHGPMGELFVRRCRVDDEHSPLPYRPQSGSDVALHARELDLLICYSETPCGG